MLTKRASIFAYAVTLFASFVVTMASASAVTFDSRTYFTFSAPVELPRVMLPPGRYVFQIVDTSSRMVTQVLSNDGKTTYGMFQTIPVQRLDRPEEAEVRFWETPSHMPPAIKTWWYPGSSLGREFIYPKERAFALAMSAKPAENVTPDETRTAELAPASPAEREATVPEEPKAAPEVTAAEEPTVTEEAQSTAPKTADDPQGGETPAADPTPASQEARATLPKTASVLPLFGLIGLVSLAGAVWIRSRR